jgi:5'-3' exonuclease
MKPRILLIDLSAIYHPAWRSNENGPVSVAFEATLGGVRRCISQAGEGALVAVCCDGKGNWRKEIDATYKAQRDPLPLVFYAEFDRVKQRLRDDGLLLWECPGFEADDLIATAEFSSAGHSVRIATHDKDLLQLIGRKSDGCVTDYLLLSTFETRDVGAVQTKYGIEPYQMGDWLALVGDSSDNVKGAPGIGPKTATKLLQAYGNLAGVFKAAYDLKSDLTPAIRKSLTENGEQIELARKLVTLRTDAPIRFEEIYETRAVKPLTEVDDVPHDMSEIEAGLDNSAAQLGEGFAGAAVGPGLLAAQETQAQEDPTAGKWIARDAIAASTELAVVEYSKQLEPRSFRDVLTFAKYAFNSRLYQKFTSPDAIAMVIVRGRELGYGAGTALEVFHVIEGRPYPFAYLVVAECQKDPDCEYLLPVEFDESHAVVETKHRKIGEPIRLTYTMERARIAGLVKDKGGWAKHPEDMLVKTALCKLGRRMYPARALGLVSLEEMGEA